MTDGLIITAYGSNPGETMPEIGEAAIGLLKAIAEMQLGEDEAAKINWSTGPMRWQCDTCGTQADERPNNWRNDGHYDYCEACYLERAR